MDGRLEKSVVIDTAHTNGADVERTRIVCTVVTCIRLVTVPFSSPDVLRAFRVVSSSPAQAAAASQPTTGTTTHRDHQHKNRHLRCLAATTQWDTHAPLAPPPSRSAAAQRSAVPPLRLSPYD